MEGKPWHLLVEQEKQREGKVINAFAVRSTDAIPSSPGVTTFREC